MKFFFPTRPSEGFFVRQVVGISFWQETLAQIMNSVEFSSFRVKFSGHRNRRYLCRVSKVKVKNFRMD